MRFIDRDQLLDVSGGFEWQKAREEGGKYGAVAGWAGLIGGFAVMTRVTRHIPGPWYSPLRGVIGATAGAVVGLAGQIGGIATGVAKSAIEQHYAAKT